MTLNAPSNTGANTAQNPIHMDLITSVILENSNPRAFNRSTIP